MKHVVPPSEASLSSRRSQIRQRASLRASGRLSLLEEYRQGHAGAALGKASKAHFISRGHHERKAQPSVASVPARFDQELAGMPYIHREAVPTIPGPERDVALVLRVFDGVSASLGDGQFNAVGRLLPQANLSRPFPHEIADGAQRFRVSLEDPFGEYVTAAVTSIGCSRHDVPPRIDRAQANVQLSKADKGRSPFQRNLLAFSSSHMRQKLHTVTADPPA